MFSLFGKILGRKTVTAVQLSRSLEELIASGDEIVIEDGVETTHETLEEISNGKGDDE